MQYSKYSTHVKILDEDYKIKVVNNWDDNFLSLVNYNSPSMDYIGLVFGNLLVDKSGVLSRAKHGYWCLTDKRANDQAKHMAEQLELSETHGLPIITRYDATDKKEKIYLRGKNGEDIEFEVYITSSSARNFLKKQMDGLIKE